jgi:hypothetical protein
MKLRDCRIVLILLLLVAGVPAAAQKLSPKLDRSRTMVPPEEPPPPYPPLTGAVADSVRAAMSAYEDAVLARDGRVAGQHVTRASHAYYARFREMALGAPEAVLRAAPLLDRLTILMIRHRIPADQLRKLSGDSVFPYMIENGWVRGSRGSTTVKEVYGSGARAAIRSNGEMYFLREDGAWRLDLVHTAAVAANGVFRGLEGRMTEDEFLLFTLEHSTGRKPGPEIWQPLP